MWKFPKMTVAAVPDVITTEEVVAEAKEVLAENANRVDLVREKKAASEATEMILRAESVLTVPEVTDLHREENRVRFKEKSDRQDARKVTTDRPDVLLKRLKTEDPEEANF